MARLTQVLSAFALILSAAVATAQDTISVFGRNADEIPIYSKAGDTLIGNISGTAAGMNLWATFTADSGTTTANTSADTLTIAGGTNVTTSISGDVLTINATGGGGGAVDYWFLIDPSSGQSLEPTGADTLNIVGAGVVTVTGTTSDTLTISAPDQTQNLFATIAGGTGSTTADSPTDTLTIAGAGIITTAVFGDTLTITGTEAQNIFQTIAVPSGTAPVADSPTDTLTFAASGDLTITGDASTDTITIANTQAAVTLVTSSHDYLSLAGQAITLGPIDLASDVTGTLDETNIDSDIARTSQLHDAVTLSTEADSVLALSGQQIGLDNQSANLVFAGPATGSPAAPTFRSLADADIPSAIARDSELPVGANPTATVGLTAVNGSATTFMRSDAAPALSQAISPTWTGAHTWDGGSSSLTVTNGAPFIVQDGSVATFAQKVDDATPSFLWKSPAGFVTTFAPSNGANSTIQGPIASGLLAVISESTATNQIPRYTGTAGGIGGYTSNAPTITNAGAFDIPGRLSLPNATSSGNSLRIGSDVDMWRSAANTLTIDDAVVGNSFTATTAQWVDITGNLLGPINTGVWNYDTNGYFVFQSSDVVLFSIPAVPGSKLQAVRVKFEAEFDDGIELSILNRDDSSASGATLTSIDQTPFISNDSPEMILGELTLDPVETVAQGVMYFARVDVTAINGAIKVFSVQAQFTERNL
jgi:hypothetical protein